MNSYTQKWLCLCVYLYLCLCVSDDTSLLSWFIISFINVTQVAKGIANSYFALSLCCLEPSKILFFVPPSVSFVSCLRALRC